MLPNRGFQLFLLSMAPTGLVRERPAAAQRPANTAPARRPQMSAPVQSPQVAADYRVQTDAAGRAIAGLSMGGGQSLTIGLNHADRFARIAGFSSSAASPDVPSCRGRFPLQQCGRGFR